MITAPNVLTLTGYSLGIWWAFGGPTWSGLTSIVLDELDGYAARKLNQETPAGAKLDLGVDVALVPLSLMRLGKSTNTGLWPMAAAPVLMYAQANTPEPPPVGSVRAGIMLFTMLMESVKK